VLSALEGLEQVNAGFAPYILPATIVILVALFVAQSRGTASVAAFFGPVMVAFFGVNTVLGLMQIPHAWIVLGALSPLPGLKFLLGHGGMGFVVFGSVFLAVTGAEALYADPGQAEQSKRARNPSLVARPAIGAIWGSMMLATHPNVRRNRK